MTLHHLNCGYVPLVDSAPLIIARELHFAADEGINLNLLRQPSWSALRDLLAMGHLEAAHILSPLPIAMSLGLGGLSAQIDTLMVLSVNGNVIGVSAAIADKMRSNGWSGAFLDAQGTATALLQASDKPLKVGIPFPYSMHAHLFDYWLRNNPHLRSDSFQIVYTPPPLMAAAIENGDLDVFCVGEPWGSVGVENGAAELILPGSAIWSFAPEKVLGVRRVWATENPDLTAALMRAVYRAARWLDQPDNRVLATAILARSEHLDLPETVIDHALSGNIITHQSGLGTHVPNFLMFHQGAATFPWRSQAAWIATQIAARHGLDRTDAIRIARACFRTDLYRQNLSPIGVDMPGASEKIEGALQQPTPVSSTNGSMVLGPDRFFDDAQFDSDPK